MPIGAGVLDTTQLSHETTMIAHPVCHLLSRGQGSELPQLSQLPQAPSVERLAYHSPMLECTYCHYSRHPHWLLWNTQRGLTHLANLSLANMMLLLLHTAVRVVDKRPNARGKLFGELLHPIR